MSHEQSAEIPKLNGSSSRWLALVFALVMGLAAAPLHAQFTFVDEYEFNCATGGCYPSDNGQLTQGSDGNLYGTAPAGGTHAFGTTFTVTTSGAYTDQWAFDGLTGEQPDAALTLASDGNFYGTAAFGGTNNNGTLFRFTPPSTVTVLHSFTTAEGVPEAPPIQGKDGNLYGVTNSAVAYSVTLTGTYKQLSPAPGSVEAPLLLASDGNLYGTALTGGTNSDGAVFRMSTPGGAIKVIHNFTGIDGSRPVGPLAQASDGNLYGTTFAGGPNNNGEVFKMTLAGKITVLHTFDVNGVSDGEFPDAGLLAASDGYLYGVNGSGGADTVGTLFRITTSGIFTKLFDFTDVGGSVPGAYAGTTLMQHTNGNLYGLAYRGGASDNGTFFSLFAPNLIQILKVSGPIFVLPGGPVQILGNNLTHAIFVNFGSVQAQFQPGTDNYLTATVPNAAVDSVISVTYDTGLQTQTLMSVHILPKITNLDPPSGSVGTVVNITGGGFTGAKKVTFGGVAAENFTVLSPSLIQATVPTGAKTGRVKVATPNGSATSPMKFTVI
ncbi:MAG: IPT/TIG domain-containing protein [Acidobacteriia bacterium]|nr:IPT/TIG domain-containing protein [Terriglobia bacterium]